MSFTVGFAFLYASLIHRTILEADCDFLALVEFTFDESTNKLLIAALQYAASFGPIIDPLSIIVKFPLVFAEAVAQAFLELPNIDVLACDKLPLPLIEIVAKIANVLMEGIGEFAVSFLGAIFELPLVDLVLVEIEPTLGKSVVLHLPDV